MAGQSAPDIGSRPAIQPHRGVAGVAPENTVRAARLAAERFGADWIEVDQPTVDGTVVCFHDPALHETDGSRGITDATSIVAATASETVLAAEVLRAARRCPGSPTASMGFPQSRVATPSA